MTVCLAQSGVASDDLPECDGAACRFTVVSLCQHLHAQAGSILGGVFAAFRPSRAGGRVAGPEEITQYLHRVGSG